MNVAAIELDPFSRSFLRDPYHYHEQLREAGPLLWFPQYQVYGVARYGEARQVMLDWETFCSSRGVGLTDFAREDPWRKPSLLLERDPPLHSVIRGVMNKVVALPRLRKLAEEWRREARGMVTRLVERQSFDAATDLAEQFPLRIFPRTLGLPEGGEQHLLQYATSVFNGFGPRNDILLESQQGLDAALQWIGEACRYENLAPGRWGRDVHDMAAEAGLAEEDRELLVRSFLSAGVDTTISGIANLIHGFATHPDQWQRLRGDRSLLKRAFDEGLRWEGTVQAFFRTTTRPVEIARSVVPEGAKIISFLASANRDPRQWADPDAFDISRSTSGHLGFGFGIHQCLGQMVARMEAEIVLEALLETVAVFRPAGAPVRRLNNTLFALASLPVVIEPV
jgi:4-methoxybenzoate monooxygenase (O-demethylating)